MKKVLTIILFVCMLGLTGCMHMVEITDEESETIARTAAWLLFKYDKNYTENLITPTPTATPTPIPSKTDLPTPTIVPGATSDPTDGNVNGNQEKEPAKVVLPEHNMSPEELLGVQNVSIVYEGCDNYDSYTFESFSVEPKNPQNSLLFVFLQLKNEGTESVAVNLLELQPKCRLYIDVSKQIAPKKTVLLNDFQYLITEISAGGSYNSVLVFEVEKPFAPERMDLYLSIGEATAYMKLK